MKLGISTGVSATAQTSLCCLGRDAEPWLPCGEYVMSEVEMSCTVSAQMSTCWMRRWVCTATALASTWWREDTKRSGTSRLPEVVANPIVPFTLHARFLLRITRHGLLSCSEKLLVVYDIFPYRQERCRSVLYGRVLSTLRTPYVSNNIIGTHLLYTELMLADALSDKS